jgi:hypothetical protein
MQCGVQGGFQVHCEPATTIAAEYNFHEPECFIPSRMITDNALIAFECIHAIKGNSDARGTFVRTSWIYRKLMTVWIGIF